MTILQKFIKSRNFWKNCKKKRKSSWIFRWIFKL